MLASILVHFERPNMKPDCWQVLALLSVNDIESLMQQCVILIFSHCSLVHRWPLARKDSHIWEQLIHLESFSPVELELQSFFLNTHCTGFGMRKCIAKSNKNSWKYPWFTCLVCQRKDLQTAFSDPRDTPFSSVAACESKPGSPWVLGRTAT